MNENNIVVAGQELKYELDYKKDKLYQVEEVVRQIVDGAVITLAPIHILRLPVGEHKEILTVKIPTNSSEGEYTFHVTAKYKVNPIRVVSVSAKSDSFTIVRDQ